MFEGILSIDLSSNKNHTKECSFQLKQFIQKVKYVTIYNNAQWF
jgi:hypothetical protein